MTSNKDARIDESATRARRNDGEALLTRRTTTGGFMKRVGLLRIGLAIVVLLCLPMALFTTTDPAGWQIVPSYVVPGLVVCIVWGLPFDILMSRIFLVGEYAEDYRLRHRSIVILDLVLLTALLVSWGPFFLSILKR